MPKHTYDVTIGKDTYEVSSDNELSDVQAYQAALAQSKAPQQASVATGGGSSLGLSGLKALLPIAQHGAESLATHPDVVNAASSLGSAAGGLHGMSGGPLAALGGMVAGGKLGGIIGGGLQRIAAPVAKGLGAITPYAQTLGTLSGAQGAGELAQMAEPTRKDIGFLGIGKTQNVPGQKPALLNSLFSRLAKIGPETQ